MKKGIIVLLCLITIAGYSQKDVTTFGVQFKPIVPSNLLRAGESSLVQSELEYTVDQKLGYSFGGVVRRGFTDWLTLETGISFVRRNYEAQVLNQSTGLGDTTRFGIIGYEIPVLGMVYVQLSDYIFMDAAFGLSVDMFPSDVGTIASPEFSQLSRRNSWIQPGLIANVGWEWRTKESGYFYIGASYHRPFVPIYESQLRYNNGGVNNESKLDLSGNYLTIDLRYFFHEEPKEKDPTKDVKEENLPSWMKNGKR